MNTKTQVNNEIILMSKTVHFGKVYFVRKWVRELKRLRAKHNNEAQQAKNKRKEERLVNEILAAKNIKNREVVTFALTNTRSQKDILQNENSDVKIRAMVKVICYKPLQDQIASFKEKFSNYEEFLKPGRRKIQKLQKKDLKDKKKIDIQGINKDKKENKEGGEEKIVQTNNEEKDHSALDNDKLICISKKRAIQKEKFETKKDVKSIENKDTNLKNNPQIDLSNKMCKMEKSDVMSSSISNNIRPINSLASVKRFTELFEDSEDTKNLSERQSTETVHLEKEADPFFMTGDGEENYMRIVVPKTNVVENEGSELNNDYNKSKVSNKRFENDKFFNKVAKFNHGSRREIRNRRENFNNNRTKKYIDTDMKNNTREAKENKQKGAKSMPNEEHLHPSWEAKRKQQEALKQGFQGRKIVFNDD